MSRRDGITRRTFVGAGGLLFFPFWLRAGGGWRHPPLGRRPLSGFGTTAISVRDAGGAVRSACVLLASTAEQRERGLMNVTSIRGYGGMLFVFPTAGTKSFWMRNTPMPLSIAFFDADGRFVSSADMAPCGDSDDCPLTSSGGPALYALEMRHGMLPSLGIGPGATLTVGGRCSELRSA